MMRRQVAEGSLDFSVTKKHWGRTMRPLFQNLRTGCSDLRAPSPAVLLHIAKNGFDKLSVSIESAIRHTKEFFECGGLPHAILTCQNNSNFFEPRSSSKDFLVGANCPGINNLQRGHSNEFESFAKTFIVY